MEKYIEFPAGLIMLVEKALWLHWWLAYLYKQTTLDPREFSFQKWNCITQLHIILKNIDTLSSHNLVTIPSLLKLQRFKSKLLRKGTLPSHCLFFMFLWNPGLQRQKTDVFIWLQYASSPHGFTLSSQVYSVGARI